MENKKALILWIQEFWLGHLKFCISIAVLLLCHINIAQEASSNQARVYELEKRVEIENMPIDDGWVYAIGSRDVLGITVLSLEEFKRNSLGDEPEFVVNENGNINIPLVGLVKAHGKTASQLIETLTQKFQKYVTNPQVSVVIKEYRSKLVHVLGKVFNNGTIPLRHENTTLFEVLADAGGFSSKLPSLEGIALNQPDMRHVFVIREGRKYVVNLYDQLIDPNRDQPFFMHAGDKVFVPEPVDTISILGGVKRAGSFELKTGMTLMQALALAGSFLEDARRDQIQIMRPGLKSPLRVNAVRIVEGKEPDFLLKGGDVVYVGEW